MNIYKLKDNLKPISWQVPLKELVLEKIEEGVNKGLRKVKYVPGTNSIYAEDLKGDYQPVSLWFENGELHIPKSDILANEILQRHPLNNKMWYLWTEDGEIQEQLEKARLRDEVRELINTSDEDNLRASSIAIFGYTASRWSKDRCELELRKYADEKPLELKAELKSDGYESKLLSALAFSKGIVATNLSETSIVWNDTTQGVILTLAKGENKIHKLGEYLSERTEESLIVMQTIGEKIDALKVKTPEVETKKDKENELPNAVKELLEKQNAEIKRLKALLENKDNPNPTTEDDGQTHSFEEYSLEELQKAYEDKFEKPAPNSKKNNTEWLIQKLSE